MFEVARSRLTIFLPVVRVLTPHVYLPTSVVESALSPSRDRPLPIAGPKMMLQAGVLMKTEKPRFLFGGTIYSADYFSLCDHIRLYDSIYPLYLQLITHLINVHFMHPLIFTQNFMFNCLYFLSDWNFLNLIVPTKKIIRLLLLVSLYKQN